MASYDTYYKCLVRSVTHIFKNLIKDPSIDEVFEAQASKNEWKVVIELSGTLEGTMMFSIPKKTIRDLTAVFVPDTSDKKLKTFYNDIAGEMANQISGTFVNQIQSIGHHVRLSPPVFGEDPIELKAFYENVNISFISACGGFDVDLYYKDTRA